MVVLKKIRAATLVEVLTASVLIIVVFMIASLSFNNVFNNQLKGDQSSIDNKAKELEYLLIHKKIKTPYIEDFDGWEIRVINNENHTTISYSKNGIEYKKELFFK